MAITNYSPPSDRTEDLHLTANEEVRLLCEDGAWSFVCTVDATKRSGWVPSSLLKSMGGSQCNMTRRSLSVGDIYNAYEEEEAAARGAPLSQMAQKRPVPTPRGDLEQKKNSVDITGAPSEEAPPLPGAPPDYIRKSGKKTMKRTPCFFFFFFSLPQISCVVQCSINRGSLCLAVGTLRNMRCLSDNLFDHILS